jgi:hypothetical protein
MPALVFPAPGFTTSTQFTGTFATFSITVPGKVASRAKLKSIDSRSFGKVLPRSNIRGAIDLRRNFGKITTFKVPLNKILLIEINYSTVGKVLPRSNISGLPVYITPPKITTFKVPVNKISSIETNYSTVSKLSPFVNQGLTSGLAYPVGGQATIINNSVNYIIDDLDILVTSTTASVSSQTLYFNPNAIFDPSKLTFTIGDYVKITNNNDFTEVVEVTTSTVNSITIDLVANLPVDKLGGLSIQSASNDLFPTASVLANYYANLSTTGIQITPTNPRENLAVSQMELPVLRYRARQYYLVTKELSDTLPLISSTTNSLSVFDDNAIPGDFRLTVTGQTDQKIYNTLLNYVNDLDILTYTTATVSVKTIYFPQQDAIPFFNESIVRIINSSAGYKQVFTVINGTSNSVSFTNPGNLPTEGLTIEKSVASVYPQSFVTTQVSPTNARENLYYFNISPGLRAGEQYFISSGDTQLNNGNVESVYPQSFVTTQVAPTNARENLYYFNISPGLRAGQQYFIASADISLLNGNISKQLSILKTSTTPLSAGKISSAAKLKSDSITFTVNKLSSAAKLITIGFTESGVSKLTQFYNQSAVLPTGAPTNARENLYYFDLAPGYRANRTIINGEIIGNSFLPTNSGLIKQPQSNFVDIGTILIKSGQVQNPISKLVYDTAIFNTGNLKSTAKLIGADGAFNNEQLDVFKIRSNTVQFFETPTLSKLTDVTSLRPDRASLTTDNLKSVSILKGDTAKSGYIEYLNPFKIRSEQVQFFETPALSKLTDVTSLRPDRASLTTDNLKSVSILREYGDSKQLYRPDSFDNYIDQTTVRLITAPTNPSERFYYFNLAPGYRRNSSIQDGKLFSPISNIIKNDRLELFDNIGYQLDLSRIYDVSGQTTGVTSNTVLVYLDDLDILTTTTTPIDSVTIFFGNIERRGLPPFLVGDTVYVTKNQDVESMPVRGFVFTVIANEFNSITIAKPADWDTTWAFSTIRLTGAEYYPKTLVKTTVAPTNAREALYYAELGPGIRTNSTISYGNTFNELLRNIAVESLTKDIFKLRTITVNDSRGLIVKLIAGDGRRGATGFIDTGAPKKEPIQFWN